MQTLRLLRIALWLAAAAAAIAYVALALRGDPPPRQPSAGTDAGAIGGPFTLTDQRGATFTEKDVAGRPHAVFFGFTHCPDVCPTTLFGLTQLMQALGPDADRLKVLFVTVDPERDTAEALTTYMSSFDPRIVALTGDGAAIDRMVRNYKAYYRKVPSGESYTMDHTAVVFLMGADGRFVITLDQHEPVETQLAKLRRLVKTP
ncbi:SCO family protein [Bosea sp. 117]|uniref:SCO family protein n=1 Tax=Bosea sp. 117 TaxID=1125973 RepID=UPI00049451FB|nr:SCO family protein [Bosea sp. 117]